MSDQIVVKRESLQRLLAELDGMAAEFTAQLDRVENDFIAELAVRREQFETEIDQARAEIVRKLGAME